MQFTKSMIELVFEIRACVPPALKPYIKLTNPELFNELLRYYKKGINVTTKKKIESLFSQADEQNWSKSLEQAKVVESAKVVDFASQQTKSPTPEADKQTNVRRKRVYRGQVISG